LEPRGPLDRRVDNKKAPICSVDTEKRGKESNPDKTGLLWGVCGRGGGDAKVCGNRRKKGIEGGERKDNTVRVTTRKKETALGKGGASVLPRVGGKKGKGVDPCYGFGTPGETHEGTEKRNSSQKAEEKEPHRATQGSRGKGLGESTKETGEGQVSAGRKSSRCAKIPEVGDE